MLLSRSPVARANVDNPSVCQQPDGQGDQAHHQRIRDHEVYLPPSPHSLFLPLPPPFPPAEPARCTREDDGKWPQKNKDGRQELEIRMGNEHISFETAKIGSLVDVQESQDPEGLRVFYYLVQDLKALVFSLIALHFKVKKIFFPLSPPPPPIPHTPNGEPYS